MSLSSTLIAHLRQPQNAPYVCALVEIGISYPFDPLKLSTRSYEGYRDAIIGDLIVDAALDAPYSAGDFEISYTAGLDSYPLESILWADVPCNIYAGDVRWDRSQFELLVPARVEHVEIVSKERLRINTTTRQYSLDLPIGTPTRNGIPTPWSVGAVRNAEPVLVDAAQLIYSMGFHYGLSGVVVRDRGVQISSWAYTNTTPGATGTNIKLTTAPAGVITVDYNVTNVMTMPQFIAEMFAITVTQARERMLGFAADWIKDTILISGYERNPLDTTWEAAIRAITDSVELYMTLDEGGLPTLRYLDYTNVAAMPVTAAITPDAVELGGVRQQGWERGYSTIELKTSKNYRQQTGSDLAGAAMGMARYYGEEWFVTSTEPTLFGDKSQGIYRKTASLADPARELARLQRKYSKDRRRWSVSAMPSLIGVVPGDLVSCSVAPIPQPQLGAPRFFVESVRLNLSNLRSTITMLEAD
jgi:hypothetical protein